MSTNDGGGSGPPGPGGGVGGSGSIPGSTVSTVNTISAPSGDMEDSQQEPNTHDTSKTHIMRAPYSEKLAKKSLVLSKTKILPYPNNMGRHCYGQYPQHSQIQSCIINPIPHPNQNNSQHTNHQINHPSSEQNSQQNQTMQMTQSKCHTPSPLNANAHYMQLQNLHIQNGVVAQQSPNYSQQRSQKPLGLHNSINIHHPKHLTIPSNNPQNPNSLSQHVQPISGLEASYNVNKPFPLNSQKFKPICTPPNMTYINPRSLIPLTNNQQDVSLSYSVPAKISHVKAVTDAPGAAPCGVVTGIGGNMIMTNSGAMPQVKVASGSTGGT